MVHLNLHPKQPDDRRRLESGQGLIEYALIMVLVAVVAVLIVTVLGPGVQKFYTNIVGILRNPVQDAVTVADLQAKVDECATNSEAHTALSSYISSSNIQGAVDYAIKETNKKLSAACAADIVGIGNQL